MLVSILALTSGTTRATIPDADGVIHGCMSKGKGSLRLIDTDLGASCSSSNETAINWNQVGPAGPVNAFHAAIAVIDLPEGGTTVVSKTLPVGKYVINAKGVTGTFSDSAAGVHCFLFRESDTVMLDESNVQLPPHGVATIALQSTTELTAPDTVIFFCFGDAA